MNMTKATLFWITGCLLGLVACSGKVDPTTVQIEDPIRHYYPILSGDELRVAYPITNTGKNPLVISEIQTSCGCIAYDDSKRIIPPGAQEVLTFRYDSFKNVGYVRHQIRLYGNFDTQNQMLLEFDVQVVPPSDHPRDYEEVFLGRNHTKSNTSSKTDDLSRNSYYVDGEY